MDFPEASPEGADGFRAGERLQKLAGCHDPSGSKKRLDKTGGWSK
jgi:hypothetical protein